MAGRNAFGRVREAKTRWLAGKLRWAGISVALQNAAHEKSAPVGQDIIRLGHVGVQGNWVRCGKDEGCGIQSVARAKAVGQGIFVQIRQHVGIRSRSPGTGFCTRAVRVHGGKIILGAGIRATSRRAEIGSAQGLNVSVGIYVFDVAGAQGSRGHRLRHGLVLGSSLALVVQKKEQLVFFDGTAERAPERVANQCPRFVW